MYNRQTLSLQKPQHNSGVSEVNPGNCLPSIHPTTHSFIYSTSTSTQLYTHYNKKLFHVGGWILDSVSCSRVCTLLILLLSNINCIYLINTYIGTLGIHRKRKGYLYYQVAYNSTQESNTKIRIRNWDLDLDRSKQKMPSASSSSGRPSTSRDQPEGSEFTWIENLIGDNGDGSPAITKQMIIGGVSGW